MKTILCGLVGSLMLLPATATAQEVREVPSPYPYPEPAWSPYLVGALIGVLVLLTLSLASKKVGASSAYSDAAGMIGRLAAPRHIGAIPYFRDNKPQIGWTFVFVLGTIGGSFVAAWSGGELTGTFLQDLWVTRFGPDSYALRVIVALAGGGCTSGHGISGTLQLAVGSWISVICFFIGGIAAAMMMYRL